MRQVLFAVLFFWIGCMQVCLAQDSTLSRRAPNLASVKPPRLSDSLLRVRRLRKRHLDSVRHVKLRDSLLAGETVHFKGKLYKIQDSAGKHLSDSMNRLIHHMKNASLRPAPRKDSLKTSSAPASAASAPASARPPHDSTVVASHPDSIKARPIVHEARPVIDYKNIPFFLVAPEGRNYAQMDSIALDTYIRKHVRLDSISKIYVFPPPAKRKVYFDPHRPLATEGSIRKGRPSWIVWILILAIMIITAIKAIYPRDLYDIFQALFNDRLIKNNRDSNLVYSPSFILMFVCFCICGGLLIYDYMIYLKVDSGYRDFVVFLIISSGILSFFILKLISYRLTAAIFRIEPMVSPYLSLLYVTVANFTLFCIPFLMVFSFFHTDLLPHLAVWIPFIILAFLIFLYIRSLIFIIANFEFPKFYLFLYFCALEICPLIIVFKLING